MLHLLEQWNRTDYTGIIGLCFPDDTDSNAYYLQEELEHALARGATIHAEVLGGSYTCDAHHMTEPNPTGEGVALCIRRALADAGITPAEVSERAKLRRPSTSFISSPFCGLAARRASLCAWHVWITSDHRTMLLL